MSGGPATLAGTGVPSLAGVPAQADRAHGILAAAAVLWWPRPRFSPRGFWRDRSSERRLRDPRKRAGRERPLVGDIAALLIGTMVAAAVPWPFASFLC